MVASRNTNSKLFKKRPSAKGVEWNELAGVGEAKAKAIVAYRETNGPFSSVDELLEVKGIGKAILDRNREKLEVN